MSYPFRKRIFQGAADRKLTLTLTLLIVSVLMIAGTYAWYDTDYGYRQNVTVNQTGSGTITGVVFLINGTSFVNTTGLIDASKLQADCDDILFSDSTETEDRPYCFENRTSTNYGCNTGSSIIWGRETSVPTTNTTQQMYYDHSTATNQENCSGVFMDANATWLFGEEQGSTAYDIDSGKNINLTLNSITWNSSGYYGYGVRSTGSVASYWEADVNPAYMSSGSMSFWYYPEDEGSGTWGYIINGRPSTGPIGTGCWQLRHRGDVSTGTQQVVAYRDASQKLNNYTNHTIVMDQWEMYTVTWDSTILKVYANLTLVFESGLANGLFNATNCNVSNCGWSAGSCNAYINGTHDSINIWNSVKTRNDIRRLYQQGYSAYVTEESAPAVARDGTNVSVVTVNDTTPDAILNDTVYIEARLTYNNGSAVIGETLTFSRNSTSIGTNTTNSTGWANYNWQTGNETVNGTFYNMNVSYGGDGTKESSYNETQTVTIMSWIQMVIADTINSNSVNSVRVADIDDDGWDDIVGAGAIYQGDLDHWDANLGNITWFRNPGNISGSWAAYNITDTCAYAHDFELVDFDGDGDIDVVGTCFQEDTVQWWEAPADPTGTWENHLVATLDTSHSAISFDFNDDGFLDVAAVSSDFNVMRVYRNTGDNVTFSQNYSVAFTDGRHIWHADMDNDGIEDIVASAGTPSRQSRWWRNHQNGTFYGYTINTSASELRWSMPYDIDGDNDNDVAMGEIGGVLYWGEQDNTTPTSTYTVHVVSDENTNYQYVYVADIDRDGDTDFASSSTVEGEARWTRTINLSGDQYSSDIMLNGSLGVVRGVHISDLNSDGKLDLIFSDNSLTSPGVYVWFQFEELDLSDPVTTLVSPSDNTSTNNGTATFNCSATDNTGLLNMTLYSNWTGSWSANETVSISGTSDWDTFYKSLPDGLWAWNCYVCDNSSNCDWGNSNFTIRVDTVSPTITIHDPQNTSYTNSSVDLRVSASEIINVWRYSLNGGANTTFTPNTTITAVPGSNNIWVYANDSVGNIGSQGPIYFTYFNYSVGSSTYGADVIEGSRQNFQMAINFSDVGQISGISGSLIHNGTSNAATVTQSGTEYLFNVTAIVGVIPTEGIEKESVIFFWNYTFTHSNGTETNQTENETQTIHRIILYNCSNSSLGNVSTLHFYIRDEENDSAMVGDIEIAFDPVTYAGNDHHRNHSWSDIGINNYTVCIYPTWAEYTVDSMSEFSKTGYSSRTYYLDNATLDNVSENITVYLSINTSTSLISMSVLNYLGLPEPDVIINAQRYFIGENVYRTIGIFRTDFKGEAFGYLIKNTVWYRFILSQDGEVLEQYAATLITEDDITFRLSAEGLGEWFQYHDQIAYNCSYSDTTNTTTCTVVDATGLMVNVTLRVREYTSLGWIETCNDYSEAASSTLVCSLGATQDKLFYYILTAEFDDTEFVLEEDWLDFRAAASIWTSMGIVIAFLLIIFLALIGSYSPTASMVLAGVGLALSYGFGFIYISYGSIVAFFIVIGIAAYKMRS